MALPVDELGLSSTAHRPRDTRTTSTEGTDFQNVLLARQAAPPEKTETPQQVETVNEPEPEASPEEVRADIAEDMDTLADKGAYQGVKSSAITEMLYVTRDDAVPGDRIDELAEELKGRRPDDKNFADAIDAAADELAGVPDPATGERTGGLWESMGRTHEVFDPVMNQWGSVDTWRYNTTGHVETALTDQFTSLSEFGATTEQIEARRDLFLRYGSDNPRFQAAVNSAAQTFLEDRPQEIADKIATAYEEGGAARAATVLREQLDGVDPLTAARALNKAQGTVENVAGIFGDLADPERPFDPDDNALLRDAPTIFNDLSRAIDSAGRSPEAQEAIDAVAQALANPHSEWKYILKDTVANGNGATLAVALAGHSSNEQAAGIREGLEEGLSALEGKLRDRVAETAMSAMNVSEPMQQWGELLDPEQAAAASQEWRNNPPDFVTEADDALSALDQSTGAYLRTLNTIQGYAEGLQASGAGHRDPNVQQFIDKVGEHAETSATDEQFQFAFQISRSAFTEAVRTYSAQNGGVAGADGPYTARELQEIVDAGVAELESGVDLGRIATYASFGVLPSYFLLSQLRYDSPRGSPKTIALLPEQFLRDSLVRFASSEQIFDNDAANYLVKSTVADVTVLLTNTGQNRISDAILRNAGGDPANHWARHLRIPGYLVAGRMAIPPIAGLSGLFDFPEAPLGPDGKPQYDGIVDWLGYHIPDGTALGASVGVPGVFITAYTKGLESLYPNGNAPGLREAVKSGDYRRIIAEGLRQGGWTGNLGTLGRITGIVMLQYFGAEALLDNMSGDLRSDLPTVDPALWQQGVEGGFLLGSVLAGALISGPWGWVAAAGIWLGGEVIAGAINDARTAAQFEGPTREYLEAAGIRPEIANILADYDGEGYSVAGRLSALANYRGANPQEVLSYLNTLTEDQARAFVDAMHDVKPNDYGYYSAGSTEDAVRMDIGRAAAYQAEYERTHPENIQGLNWWVTRFLPGFPEGTPSPPPTDGPRIFREEWSTTTSAQAWRAEQDLQALADHLGKEAELSPDAERLTG